MKKFTESISDSNLFGDESLLNDILVDYVDIGMKYQINYNLQKNYEDSGRYHAVNYEDLISVKSSQIKNSCWDPKTGKCFLNTTPIGSENYIKCYVIQFEGYAYEPFVSDAQRIGSWFGIPTSGFYEFINITKDVQYRVESMGHTFTLCGNFTDKKNGLKIMILEGKHK